MVPHLIKGCLVATCCQEQGARGKQPVHAGGVHGLPTPLVDEGGRILQRGLHIEHALLEQRLAVRG